MDISDEEYYGEMKLMFQTKGWELLITDLMENAQLLNNLQDVADEKDLYTRRGKLDTIGLLLNFPETLRRAEEEQNESPE